MDVSLKNIQKAIEQQYNSSIGQEDLDKVFGHEKLVATLIILQHLKKLPGNTMVEVLAVAHLAAMNQVIEDS
ncbi:MAG: hypothetical protein G3W58_22915 [Pantoea ananatis]|nr:hypothetical protein [Pantoea ananatis]